MNSPLSELLRDKGESSKTVHTISADATVTEAVGRMNQHKIGALLVVDGATVLGIFTERDVLQRVVATTLDATRTPVAAVMTRAVVQVHPTTLVEQAMAIMTEKHCRHLPVMEGDRAVGMVSIGDLTRWLVRGQSIAIKDLIEYIQGKYPG